MGESFLILESTIGFEEKQGTFLELSSRVRQSGSR